MEKQFTSGIDNGGWPVPHVEMPARLIMVANTAFVTSVRN
jgi:hypothetical protein